MSDPRQQRDIARRLEQTQVIERPGGISGFTTFYAQGTFTPTFSGITTTGSFTYSVQTGFYTRVGNRVFFNCSIGAATRPSSPTGGAVIDGLPFTSNATANSHSPVSLDTIDGFTLSATCMMLCARIPPNKAYIEFIEILGTAPTVGSVLPGSAFGTTAFVRLAGSYMV